MQHADSAPKILVVGVGALGGVVTHELMTAGHAVSVLTHDPGVARVLRISGLREVRSGRLVLPEVLERQGPHRTFDYVFLVTQPSAIDEVGGELNALLGDSGRVVCFQNGLCEERVARFVPKERVVGAVVAFGASSHGVGLCERTSTGGIVVGNFDGALDESLERLADLLHVLGPIRVTSNLSGIRWSKLAINSAISTLGTIGGDRLGVLLSRIHVRELALEIVGETVRVALANGTHLERLPGLPPLEWIAQARDGDSVKARIGRVARHAMTLGVGTRYRRLRSSMLRAIERGRPPAVDFLNGEVVDHGERVGVPTPVNRAARDLVWAISRGEAEVGMPSLERLYEDTRGAASGQ